MNKALDQLRPGARFLILRLRSLGDCVLTTPAIELLHDHRPELRIGVAVEERFAGVFAGNPRIAEVMAPVSKNVARFGADLCLNLHGGTRSMALTAMSRARLRAGFGHHSGAWLYNLRIPRAQEILGVERKVHTAEHLASAMFWLGVPQREIPRASLYADAAEAGKPYGVIHAMAAAPEKTWPAERFVAVARHLVETGLEPVFIGAAGEDMSAFASYRRMGGAPLEEVTRLLSGASLFVGNDSGPAHMAAALGVPVVVLYMASDPVIWAPWKTAGEALVGNRIGVDEVIGALERLRVKT